MSNIFDRYYKKYDAWYDRNKFAYLSELEAVRKVLPKKGKGLEIGVGTGRFAQPLGIQYGIDPSKRMLEIARKRGVEVRVGYGEKVPFTNSVFDYVAIIITICFVKNPAEVLREAYRVLNKNGRIIVGIIDKESFLGKFYQRKKSIFYRQANFFSVKELVNLLKATGFSRFTYYQTLFHFPQKMNSIETPRKGFGQGGFVVIRGKKRRGV
jgi:ubiquinone/menaquinone biosynthesis C-methylase UbiE